MTLYPAFPLGTSYIPGDAVVLRVFESRYLDLVNDVMQADRQFVSALISSGSEVGGGDKRFDAGVMVCIDRIEQADVGLMIFGRALHPVLISEWNDDMTYPRATCLVVENDDVAEKNPLPLLQTLAELATDIENFFTFLMSFDIQPPAQLEIVSALVPLPEDGVATSDVMTALWSLVRMLPMSPLARYEILRPQTLEERVRRAQEEIQHMSDLVRFRYGN